MTKEEERKAFVKEMQVSLILSSSLANAKLEITIRLFYMSLKHFDFSDAHHFKKGFNPSNSLV